MKLYYSRTTLKYLQGLEGNVARKIVEVVDKLHSKENTKKLGGKKIKNIFLLRIGRYHVILNYS